VTAAFPTGAPVAASITCPAMIAWFDPGVAVGALVAVPCVGVDTEVDSAVAVGAGVIVAVGIVVAVAAAGAGWSLEPDCDAGAAALVA